MIENGIKKLSVEYMRKVFFYLGFFGMKKFRDVMLVVVN